MHNPTQMPSTSQSIPAVRHTFPVMSRDEAVARALAGADFLVRHQVREEKSAERGRFPMIYDCAQHRMLRLSTNWTTGVAMQACLQAWRVSKDQKYLDAAGLGADYLRSLQEFSPTHPRLRGVFHEISPQSELACPRDATTAAWARADWYQESGDKEALERSRLFAEWFLTVGTERGFTYWNTYFSSRPWDPDWSGSFHCGEAIYFFRLFKLTGEPSYREMALQQVRHFVRHHLDAEGRITVAVDPATWQPVARDHPHLAQIPRGWEIMHLYNSDFAAVACLCAHHLEPQAGHDEPARRFLDHMVASQREDGGFGPAEFSVRSAGGMVAVEMMTYAMLDADRYAALVPGAMHYLASIQWREPGGPADGAFLGVTDEYTDTPHIYNIRASSYAIMGLLQYGTGEGPFRLGNLVSV
jgi:hypothetical protein